MRKISVFPEPSVEKKKLIEDSSCKGFKMGEINEKYPSEVSHAVQLLLYNLPFKDKFEVATKTESELPELRSSLGKYIQNEFSLDSNPSLIESCLSLSDNGAINSEDASLIIIKEFWKQLRAA